MKLILKQYLSSLKERGELDAVLPELLRQMGLKVISTPGIGVRQYGVDIAAVGRLDRKLETVYLLSVKSGNLSRTNWDNSKQSLRSSLNEIIDVYIHTHIPAEHKGKPISICICIGGDIKEDVRPNITQFENENETDNIKFLEWDGDKLVLMIEKYLLSEQLLPNNIQPRLRKSLALLDEPATSFKHFAQLVQLLSKSKTQKNNKHLIRTLRQLNICLWILFSWARDAGNLECAYLSAERVLLHSWNISKEHFIKKSTMARNIMRSFFSIFNTYQQICDSFLEKIIPHVDKRDALSFAVQPESKIDVNLKLFDLLGRMAVAGIWYYWLYHEQQSKEESQLCKQRAHIVAQKIKNFIDNNSTLLLPRKDDHAIDISLTLLLFSYIDETGTYASSWLTEMMNRITFSYKYHGLYPCASQSYRNLLEHPKSGDVEYQKRVTSASILYPIIAMWAALLNDDKLFESVKKMKDGYLQHCDFQLWYPDEITEAHLYTNSDSHGAMLSDIHMNVTPKEFLAFIRNECDQAEHFNKLSAVKYDMLPLILVACRHYHIPPSPHFALGYCKN